MQSLKVSILGRQYPLKVEDTDVDMMTEIAGYVDDRLNTFKNELVNQPETTVLVLTCLSLAEELFLERRKNSQSDNIDDVYRYVTDKLDQVLSEIKH